MAKRVSIKDIANKVGVSTALVSYVLNGLEKEKRIGPEVVKKIHEAVKELNYQPNQIARSLRKGSTSTIGLIVADISNPFLDSWPGSLKMKPLSSDMPWYSEVQMRTPPIQPYSSRPW